MKIKNLKIKIAIALTLVVAGFVGLKSLPTAEKNNSIVAENTTTNSEQNNSVVAENEDSTQEDAIQYDEGEDPNEDYYQLGDDVTAAELEAEIKETKQYMQDEYGTDNEFQTVYESDTEKEEINPVTGEDRITNKVTNKVEVNNYFEQLDKALEEAKARENVK